MLANLKNKEVNVIGGGLAGCEASLFLAKNGIKVNLYEMKPNQKTPAHKSDNLGELVCSNSLKSVDIGTASGLLKKELELLGCSLLEIAKSVSVSAGSALAVDRNKFATEITNQIKNNKNINLISCRYDEIDTTVPTIIATGPLTDDILYSNLQKLIGDDNCYFYDAIAPIVSISSIDFESAFWADRYDKGEGQGDYLNCPLNKQEYENFVQELVNAERVELKDFEKVFEGCMAVEVMAKRGFDALRFGPMKPVGLFDKRKDERPYAVLQLRKEDNNGECVNLVGFQTNLKFPEQKRVFSMIPALKNAEFIRYGQMHRNSYVNAPKCLNVYSQLKEHENIFIAGQLSGVEGYVESIASGLYCAINMLRLLENKPLLKLDTTTIIGALMNHISSCQSANFQPMNANFGILSCDKNFKDKKMKKQYMCEQSLKEISRFKEELYGN